MSLNGRARAVQRADTDRPARETVIGREIVRRLFIFAAGLSLCGGHSFAGQPEPSRQFSLQAQSARFWKLVRRDSKLVLVAKDFGFTEGPVWDPAGFLYVSDEV